MIKPNNNKKFDEAKNKVNKIKIYMKLLQVS